MGPYVFLLCVISLPMVFSRLVAGKRDGFRLATVVGVAGVAFLVLLTFFNDAFPFSGGGDDEDYFRASQRSFTTVADWFDTGKYEEHEQAGYPLLLAWVNQISGDSLFDRKALNVFFLLLTSVTWFAIGKAIGGKKLAFVCAFGVLLATPLWFYWIFLLKDMTIAFLQSLFVLGLVLFISGEHRFRGYVIVVISTLAVIPFRSMTVLVNIAALVVCTVLLSRSAHRAAGWFVRLALVGVMVSGLLILVNQPGMMEALGAKGENRRLTAEGVEASAKSLERAKYSHPLMFPILFLVGETDALNPAAWRRFDPTFLRPLLMVPWIYFGLPFFLAGSVMMFRRKPRGYTRAKERDIDGTQTEIVQTRFTCLLALLAFVTLYAGVGWLTRDTTRWTLSAIPAMVGIAGFAWMSMRGASRLTLVALWAFLFSAFIAVYYLMLR